MPENPMTVGGSGAGLPPGLAFPHFSPFGGLQMDQRGHHNFWEQHNAATAAARYHQAIQHGLSVSSGSSPSLSDLSLLAGRPRSGPEGGVPGGILGGNPGITGSAAELHAAAAAVAYSRLTPYMDPLYTGLHTSPTASFRLSPNDSRGSVGLGMPPDYMSVAASGFCPRSLSDLQATSTLGSAELAFAFENSRFASPRASINRQSRKRALSCSPYSESFDINSMMRFSPNQLLSIASSSRGSSVNGSFGHLSAGAMSPALGMHPAMSGGFGSGMPPLQQLQAHLLRSGPLAGSLPGSPFLHHSGLYNTPFAHQSLYMPSFQHSLNLNKQEGESAPKASPGVGAVSSTMEVDEHHRGHSRKVKVRREPATTTCGINGDEKGDGDGMKDEPEDFIETNCHWTDCHLQFNTQGELVQHINTDHIHANKKIFICKWKDCSREEKPFKAQYMLVVHMRRHTGEKPHRCTFEGCTKAYSRLENLKTHLRSHTGEKPYTCEFPGCTKAFSNASDRAKHQNRTHSNEKPYVCKAPGCTKRYTDPSSLRKHVKTVHGADFYASKKHKGNDHPSSNDDRSGKGNHRPPHAGSEESPRSEDMGSKTTSISSPSIKSEDPNSPHQQSSPGGDSTGTEINGGEPMEDPISDNNVSTTNEMSDNGYGGSSPMMMQQQQCWEVKEEEEPVQNMVEMPEMILGLPIGVNGAPDDVFGGGGGFGDSRNRFRSRLGAKGFGGPMPSLSDTHGPRRGLGIENLNRRITDLKMEGTPSNSPANSPSCQGKTLGSDLSHRLSQTNLTTLRSPQDQNATNRRDSGNSTLSSYYSSMLSDGGQNSRRSSALSQVSNPVHPANNLTGRALTNASPYDPISPGSSRRSSGMENHFTNNNNANENEMAPNPLNSLASSSNTLTSSIQAHAHLERLYRRTVGMESDTQATTTPTAVSSNGNYLIQSQSAALRTNADWMSLMQCNRSTNASGEIRRMSDPCTSGSRQMQTGMNYVTPNQLTQALQRHQQNINNGGQQTNINNGYHQQNNIPNQSQNLDDLVIPDEMANFLCEAQNRPSTCPPNSSGYPISQPHLPPPPSYNQAVNSSMNNNNGHMNAAPQNQQRRQMMVPHNPNNNNGQVYNNMCSPTYSNKGTSSSGAAVSSPYNQPIHSPVYSQHSSVMSPKCPSMASPMSVPSMSPAIPPSPVSSGATNNHGARTLPPPPLMQNPGSPMQSHPNSSFCPIVPQRQVAPQNSTGNPAMPVPFHPVPNSQQPSSYSYQQPATNNNHANANVYPNSNVQQSNQNYQQVPYFANNNGQNHSATTGPNQHSAQQQYNNNNQSYSVVNGQGVPSQLAPTLLTYQNYSGVNHPIRHDQSTYNTNNATNQPAQQGYGQYNNYQYHPQTMGYSKSQQQQNSSQSVYSGENMPNNRPSWTSGQAAMGSMQNSQWATRFNQSASSNPNTVAYQYTSSSGYYSQQSGSQQQNNHQHSADCRCGQRRGSTLVGGNPEIQCKSVTSQSQHQNQNKTVGPQMIMANNVENTKNNVPIAMSQQQQQLMQQSNTTASNHNSTNPGSNITPPGMRPDAYQRTLEYVQQCQQQLWDNKDRVPQQQQQQNGTGSGEHSNPLSPDSTTDPINQNNNNNNVIISTKSPLKQSQTKPNNNNMGVLSQPVLKMNSDNTSQFMNQNHGLMMMPQQQVQH